MNHKITILRICKVILKIIFKVSYSIRNMPIICEYPLISPNCMQLLSRMLMFPSLVTELSALSWAHVCPDKDYISQLLLLLYLAIYFRIRPMMCEQNAATLVRVLHESPILRMIEQQSRKCLGFKYCGAAIRPLDWLCFYMRKKSMSICLSYCFLALVTAGRLVSQFTHDLSIRDQCAKIQ